MGGALPAELVVPTPVVPGTEREPEEDAIDELSDQHGEPISDDPIDDGDIIDPDD